MNNFTFVNGGDALSLGSGVSTVNLTGGFYGSITSYSGTNTITVGTDAEYAASVFLAGSMSSRYAAGSNRFRSAGMTTVWTCWVMAA